MASSSAPYPQESNPWISTVSGHTSPHVVSESQTPAQDQRCQSRPSARNSVIPSVGGSSKNHGADQKRLQISDLHFGKFPTPATFTCWKIRFKTGECTCSQFPTEAMLWIKEVELVDSVDNLKSSCSVRGIRMPDFEVLDARIASALNKIIHNSQFKRRISLEEQKAQKEDRFSRGRQIAYLIYDYFRVTGSHDSVENYADLFTISLRNDDIQECDSKWDGILLSMTKIPHDDTLEGLYKLRIRESEKLKTVLELYDLEIHQKKLRTWLSQIESYGWREVSNKKFEIRILGPGMEILKETPWSRIREQNSVYKEFLEIIGNGKPTGSVWKETLAVSATIWISVEKVHHQIRLRILSCGRMSENHRGPEVPEVRVPVVECRDGLERITSEELAITHFVKNGTLQNACSTRPRVVASLGKSAHSHTVRLMNSRRKGPNRIMTKVLWLCWKREIGKRENSSQMLVTIERGNLWKEVVRNWDKIHPEVNLLMHANWVVYFRTWRRRSLVSGRAQTCRSQSNVWNSQRLLRVILKFETKIPRSVTFVQVNLMSVAPTLQNLRIGLKKRQSG